MFGRVVLLALMSMAFPAVAETAVQCPVRYAAQFVDHVDDLPKDIRDDILKDGKIADPGQPFQAYDNITDPGLPNRRLVLAGRSGVKWFVAIDHGGFVRHYDVFGFSQLFEKVDRYTWQRSALLQGDPCIAINAFLDGVTTPTDGVH